MSQAPMGLAQPAASVSWGPETEAGSWYRVGGGTQEGREIRNGNRKLQFLVDFFLLFLSGVH